MGRQAKDHHARGVEVQPVHQQHGRERAAQPLDQAIGPVFAPARHRQQPGGLVDHQHLVVGVDHPGLFVGGAIGEAHFQTSRSASPANITEAMRFTTRIRAAIALPARPATMP